MAVEVVEEGILVAEVREEEEVTTALTEEAEQGSGGVGGGRHLMGTAAGGLEQAAEAGTRAAAAAGGDRSIIISHCIVKGSSRSLHHVILLPVKIFRNSSTTGRMLGESALSLVKEAARNKGNLNPFNEDLVRQTIEETRRLWEQNRYCSGEYMILS